MHNAFSQASFVCNHCGETIYIPAGLPPTTSPCPHCGVEVTSPDLNASSATLSEKVPISPKSTEKKSSQTEVVATSPKIEEALPVVEHKVDKIEPQVQPMVVQEEEGLPTGKKRGSKIMAVSFVMLLVVGLLTWWLVSQVESEQSQATATQQEVPESESDPVDESSDSKLEPIMVEDDWVDEGWKRDAEEVLGIFLASRSPEEKMEYVISNEGVIKDLETYFPEGADEDVRLSGFRFNEGNKQDREEGVFLMKYSGSSEMDVREYFAPIRNRTLFKGEDTNRLFEVRHQIGEGDDSGAVIINAYFKKTDEGLKLDSSVFIQGKFRTFRAFTNYPQPGESKVFRVAISEVMSHDIHDDESLRAYKISDICYSQDHVIIEVKKSSQLGKILATLNWRGTNKQAAPRAATIELAWSDSSDPEIKLKKILCWEFLGVGGELGNTNPKVNAKQSVNQ